MKPVIRSTIHSLSHLFLIGMLLWCGTRASATGLVGIAYNKTTSANEIRLVDPSTGSASLLNSFTFVGNSWAPSTLILDASAGRFYTIASGPTLYTFHAETGAVLSTHPVAVPQDTVIQGLAGARTDGILVGIAYNSATSENEIRTIDPSTGGTSLLNSFTFVGNSWAPSTLILDASAGRFYTIASGSTLYTFHAETGAVLSTHPLAVPQGTFIQGLAGVRADGLLVGIAYNSDTSENEIRTIDPATGEMSLLNAFAFDSGAWSSSTLVLDAPGGRLYALSSAPTVYTFDASTGSLLSTCSASLTPSTTIIQGLAGPLAMPGPVAGSLCSVPGAILYWTEQGDANRIARLSGFGGIESSVELGSATPHGLAIEPMMGNLYWTAAGAGDFSPDDKTQRSDADGTDIETLDQGEPYRGLEDVVLDPGNGKMYWTDPGDASDAVYRADLDGSGRELLAAGVDAHGIALDIASGHLYLTESDSGTIERRNLDGSGPFIVYGPSNGLVRPEGIALDLGARRVYFTDRSAGKVYRGSLDGSAVLEELVSGLVSPAQIVLDPSRAKMYVTDYDAGRIYEANLDGSDLQPILEQLDHPQDLPEPGGTSMLLAGGLLLWGMSWRRNRHLWRHRS